MVKKIMAISLALVMVFSFTACEGEELASAQEIVDGATEAVGDMRTCRFDMDMTMNMTGEAEGEAVDANADMNSSGTLDIENNQMRMDMTMNMAMTGEDEIEMGIEMYLVDNMIYMMMDIPAMGPMWMKSEMPTGYWEQMNQIEPQIELLEAAEVKVTGSETVGGIDCYVVEITPDMEQLWQIAMQQTELAEGIPDIDEEFLDEVFRSYSVKQWIAKDTYFLAKAEIELDMELTPEAMGYPEEEGEMTLEVSIILVAYDYNQPVSIELPPEAEEAIDMSSMGL